MSTWRDRLEEEASSDVALEWFVANYHYPVLAALFAFGFWTRIASWENFRVRDAILFSGNDPFYHLRSVQYVVANWPATMPFDPWTNFAAGTSTSQMGTLFDQLIATAALIVGLGSPTDQQVRLVVLFAPAVFGVLTFVPAYFIGRRLGGRFGGVMSVAILAFATGSLFVRSWAGTADHHVAEALFQAVGVLGVMVAVSVAEEEKPVYELVAEREFGAIRRTLGWSVLAGFGMGLYLAVWPPGVLLLGILGVFFVVYLSVEFLRGRSPEHVAIAGAIALGTTGVIALSMTNSLAISATSRSLLQPGMAFGVAAGCVFMAWLAREWDERDLVAPAYPITVVGIGVVIVGLLAILLPRTFDYLLNNVLRVVGMGYGTSATAATVGEIASMPLGELVEDYSLAALVAFAAIALVVVRQVLDEKPRGEEVLVVVWFVFVLMASLTQQRFAYYLAVPIAALNALLVGAVVTYVARTSSGDGIETYQVLTVVSIVLVILAPMALFAPTAMDVADQKNPGGVVGWQASLEWLPENTPEPGQYANPDGEPMEYLGTYRQANDFDYPLGAYGILSWWDYGHWITTQGHRIPNANPFQQGSDHAARFLLAQNESAAAAELADRDEDDAQTRYVMVDWKMAETQSNIGGKYFAPPAFVDDVSVNDFYSNVFTRVSTAQGRQIQPALVRHKQPYYDSMTTRLYRYHGSAMEPEPVVVEWQGREQQLRGNLTYTMAPEGDDQRVVHRFDSMAQAREYVAESPSTRQIGGIGPYPSERVPALEHYRLVHAGEFNAMQDPSYRQYQRLVARNADVPGILGPNATTQDAINWLHHTTPSWTKTFERVDGATINGTGPRNATVTARVQLVPNAGEPFEYTQRTRTDENGEFNMTVPYATTGYDEWGPEAGYTNTSVRATGPYRISTNPRVVDNLTIGWHAGTVNVTEGQVIGEDDAPATVELEERSQSLGDGDDDADGNGTDDADGGDQPDGGDGTDGGSDGGTNESGASIDPALGAIGAGDTRAVQP